MRRLEIAVLIILKLAAIACTAYGELPPGTVLVSKNIDPALNTSIGDANHVAIVALDGSIIESQEGKGVQKITLA
jgi:cell wall-associated NlpC family hydrolase